MRNFFRVLLMALVLMTVALISAVTAMQLAIHGREVTIPKLVGMNPVEAERAGAAFGLQVVIERQFYSPDVPEGKIMTQMPPPGTKVRRGLVGSCRAEPGTAADCDPRCNGRQRAHRGAEHHASRTDAGFSRAHQIAGGFARSRGLAKSARERQRSRRAKNQFADQ